MQAVATVAAEAGVLVPDPSLAANTTAGAAFAFVWKGGAKPRHVFVQNNTAASLNWDVDTAATLGSPVLPAGGTLTLDVQMGTLSLLTAANQNVNGAGAGNIVVRGWI